MNSPKNKIHRTVDLSRAGDGTRTRDNHVGNVMLYQLSYSRIFPVKEQNFEHVI